MPTPLSYYNVNTKKKTSYSKRKTKTKLKNKQLKTKKNMKGSGQGSSMPAQVPAKKKSNPIPGLKFIRSNTKNLTIAIGKDMFKLSNPKWENTIVIDPAGDAFKKGSNTYTGGGLSGYLYKKVLKINGKFIYDKVHKLSPIHPGEAKINTQITKPKFVIHAVGPNWRDKKINNKISDKSYYDVLKETIISIAGIIQKNSELENKAIALPLISAGKYSPKKLDLKTYFQKYIEFIKEYLITSKNKRIVILCIYSKDEYKEYKKYEKEKSTSASAASSSSATSSGSTKNSKKPITVSVSEKKTKKKPTSTKTKTNINNLQVVPSESESFFDCVVNAVNSNEDNFYKKMYEIQKKIKQNNIVSFDEYVKKHLKKIIENFTRTINPATKAGNANIRRYLISTKSIIPNNSSNEDKIVIDSTILRLIEKQIPIRFITFITFGSKLKNIILNDPKFDIQFLLKIFQDEEEMELENRIARCEEGGHPPPDVKKIDLVATDSDSPDSIIISIKRFRRNNNKNEKLNTKVKINPEIKISKTEYYLKGYILHLKVNSTDSNESTKSGHYVFVETLSGNKNLYDDSRFNKKYENDDRDIKNAYILLYEKKSRGNTSPGKYSESEATFQNNGNTCFLNSVLQLLFRITKLKKKIFDNGEEIKKIDIGKNESTIEELENNIFQKDKLKGDNMLRIIYKIFNLMNKKKSRKIINLQEIHLNGEPLIDNLAEMLNFTIGEQHDSSEFMDIILNLLFASNIGTDNEFKKILEIKSKQTIICSKREESNNNNDTDRIKPIGGEKYIILPLQIAQNTHIRYIMLQNQEDNKYNLWTYKGRKIFKITELPPLIQKQII